MKPKIYLSAIFLVISTFFAVTPAGVFAAEPSFAPLNPEFVKYLDRVKTQPPIKTTGEGCGTGYVPSPVDLSHLKGRQLPFKKTLAKDPGDAFYDLRTLGRLTPVKYQGQHGTCWAFAALASLESWILKDEGITRNFSENNLANLHGFDLGYIGGGNNGMATAYLARWAGPVDEEDDPYDPDTDSRIGASTGNETVQKHVQQVISIPPRGDYLDNDNIKYAVVNYGAVSTLMYIDTGTYFNFEHNSYYYNGSSSSNHVVAIVGWDDNFNKANFNTAPPGNGAFIVRNSWGEGFGENGYFYISYYDTVVGLDSAVFNNAEPAGNYSRIYQYDPLGLSSRTGYGSETGWFANIFTAVSAEQVEAVSFYTSAINSQYEVYVYTGVTAGQPTSGTLASTKTGTLPYPGYNTVVLDTPAAVAQGEKFSVVVKLTTPGFTYPVPLEIPMFGYSGNATANTGESYAGDDGTSWTDIAAINPNTNVCLKAFTSSDEPALPILGVNPEFLDFGTSDTGKTFDITNTGGGTLEWSVGAAVYNQGTGWITSAIPASGTTTTEADTVTVTVSRAALAAGTYTATIPVTSNGGNANVAVTMTVEEQVQNPAIGVSPLSLDFGMPQTSLAFDITNTGGGKLEWNVGAAVYDQGTGWITSAIPASGTTTTEADTVTVTVSRAALAAGTYTATIPVTSNGGSKDVSVSMTVEEQVQNPAIEVSPTSLSFGTSLTSMAFTVTNTGGGTLEWSTGTFEYLVGGVWTTAGSWIISALPASGSNDAGTGTEVTVTIDREGLEPGSYTGKVPVNSNAGKKYVHIYMTVVPPDTPAPVSPADGKVDVTLPLTLKATSYLHPEGLEHINSQWQIAHDAGFDNIKWYSTQDYPDDPATTQLIVPAGRLESNTTYYWRVRYRSNPWSGWSPVWSFTTGSFPDVASSEGIILYVKEVVRSASGDTVVSTGDLFIKDVDTSTERQITNLAGTYADGAINNPQFTPDGKFIFFTYSENTTDLVNNPFKAYSVSIYATLGVADLAKAEVMLREAGQMNAQYAAVSNNYNGQSIGYIAFTQPGTGGRTDIWLCNLDPDVFPRKIRSVAGETVRHITFLDNANIAFVGINIEGVQNLYTMNVSTLAFAPLTDNGTNSPLYGRLMSPLESPGLIIYSKATWAITSYTMYDVFIWDRAFGTETNVSLTPGFDEFDPALHGTTPGAPADDGLYRWMYYADEDKIWRSNYTTDEMNTNLLLSQMTAADGYGLVNWAPAGVDIATDIGVLATDIDNTVLINENTGMLYKRTGTTGTTIQLGTLNCHLGADITLDGGTIVYIYEDAIGNNWNVGKMSHDANMDTMLVHTSTSEISHPRISSDGQWVVYLKEAGLEVWVASLNDITGTETVITTSTIPIDPPSFNPDMTGIIYAKKQAIGNNRDVYTTAVVLDPIAGTVAVGAETPRTNRSTTNDRYPAYSNDGTKILFKSDLHGSDAVYRMDVSGTNLEMIAGIAGSAKHFRYGPVHDSENETDGISYMEGGTVWTAYIARAAGGAVSGAADTGIANEQFGWGKVRTPGTVVARRFMGRYASKSVPFEYDIAVDVDETQVPVSFILSEIIPDYFTLNKITALDGAELFPVDITAHRGVPHLGLTTYKVFFNDNPVFGNLSVRDNVLRFNVINTAYEGLMPLRVP